jgi:hypothetical protein
MNPRAMKSWMEKEFALDGVLAAGGGMDLDSGFSALATGELVLAADDEVWRAVAATLHGLHASGAVVDELLWGFENAVLCTIKRNDGAWLGVFSAPKLSDDSAFALRARLDAFKEQAF